MFLAIGPKIVMRTAGCKGRF